MQWVTSRGRACDAHMVPVVLVGGYGAIMALAGACDAVALLNHPSSSDFSTDPA